MTQLIPGKRYSVTRTGTARPSGQLIELDGGALVAPDDPGTTVELLPDPLPTTPGSVIRWTEWSSEVRTLCRNQHGIPWRDVNSPHLCFRDEEVQGATVLFDAGAERA